ncbi:uncharacterized protein LOC130510690 [Raphanus sativus]|uniref:Uncharacterized protein LOC130510690 n=1 Tax=Raphanus sativus TaxID=3726 RepID=A0A9W3DHG4_RAPSA|nr:uncharacterized protein LOC130510690 [Raphanus sativus]XP_056863237.1 uncharacterized protein LOC130510690 [Raphanus sativus]
MMLKASPRSDMDCCANQQQSEDQEVDILEFENLNDEEGLCQSSSSSFGDSLCARDDDDDCGFEAQSMLSKDYPLPESFGDGTELLGLRKKKKKKLTDEWRRFSQPLMWRCKWLELKVKELESQARGYDKEVQSYDGDDQTQRMSVFKRGRRRRVEETTDVSAYISNHNVFSYAEKRKPRTLKAQCPVPGEIIVLGEEDESEDDCCFVSESHCSDDDLIGKILCKIDEAQDKAKRLKKRVDELMMCNSHNTSSMPRTIAQSRSDFTAQTGKQHYTLVEGHNQREGSVKIGRQRISADHNEDVLLIPQGPPPPFEVDGQFLFNNSPNPYGGLRFPSIEDLLMDGDEYEGEPDKEELDHCFMKLMNEFGGETIMSEEEEEEEDIIPPH